MTIRMLVGALLLCVACGGADSPAPAQPAQTPHEGHESHESHEGHEGHEPAAEKHDHAFPPAVTAFHDVLSPHWHADPGPGRVDATCGAVASMTERAAAVAASSAPAGVDAGAWTTIGEELVQSVASLGTACDVDGRPNFDAAFTSVHDAFHAFVDIAKKS